MKIAFLNIYQEKVNRGAETYVYELSTKLRKHGHDVSVLHTGTVNLEVDWRRKDTTHTLGRMMFVDYWSRLIMIFTLRVLPILWREKFDVVIPLNGGWQSAIVRIATWLYGGKMVISGQSGMGWDDIVNLLSLPDAFLALSSKAKVWAKLRNPFVRVERISNGVDLGKFSPTGRRFKTSLEHSIVLCVGALTPGKRISLVVEAVAKTKRLSLLVVGGGDLKDEISSLGKRLLGNKFQLIKVPYTELPDVYRAADLFSLVSAPYHSFEIVLVEAMATNLPVVVNDDPIRHEIVGDAGVFVDPTNASEYAAALEKALKTNWGDKPRKQAEKFSWDKIAGQYEKLFKELRN